MKTAIIGGGKACRAILEMVREKRLGILNLDVVGVVAPRDASPGMVYARHMGIPTYSRLEDILAIDGLEMVIELVGSDVFLEDLYRLIPPGVRVLDHVMAKVFSDLENVGALLENQILLRDELESKLRNERNLLDRVLDSLPDVVIVVDHRGRLRWVNARLKEFTGLESRDLEREGRFVDPFGEYQAGEGEGPLSPVADAVKRGSPLQLIYMDPKGKNRHRYFRVYVNPIFDEQGGLRNVVETARPITEEVEMTRDTLEREDRFRQFVDNALDMISMKDLQGRYIVINKMAARLLGKSPVECLGRRDRELISPSKATSFEIKDQKTLEFKEPWRMQESMLIGGITRYFDTVRFPLWDYKGDPKGVCSLSREITEQKRLELEVIKSEKMAAIGKLAAIVAHEINNPLTGVLTFAEELMRDLTERSPQDPSKAQFEVIIREAMRCRKIVSHLLDYTRIQTNCQPGQDLNRAVELCLAPLRDREDFENISFQLELGGDLPLLSFDPNQMQQVFLNLVLNAADAMGQKGAIRITTSLSANKEYVEASVLDEGPGVPEKLRQKIFEPFFSTKGSRGNGLGLSVVQNIIDQHGGRISVKGGPSGGTAFSFVLPLGERS